MSPHRFTLRFFSLFNGLLLLWTGLIFCPILVAATPEPQAAPPLAVLTPENGFSGDPKAMMTDYLLRQIDLAKKKWDECYDTLKTPEDILRYQQERRAFFLNAVGDFPEKTPLNPRITKRIDKGLYRVEMVLFESRPRFYVTAALFLPAENRWKAPYPGMIVLCGHTHLGKEYEAYQKTCALAAANGIAALIVDPIDQGERSQVPATDGKTSKRTTHSHNICNIGSIPLGRSAAHFEIWDMIRALDYLQTRSDIIPEKLGAAGNSGGGTQASYIMALDDRVKVAAPACYLCSLYGKLPRVLGPQDAEQNIFGQLRFGMDHADYVIMRAPKPTLMCTATRDFFDIEDAWKSFRAAKRIYDRFGDAERVSLIETDEKHGWTQHLREAAVRWMCRWLDGRDTRIDEPADLPVLNAEEIQVAPGGQVLNIEGARSFYDINREEETKLASQRRARWAGGWNGELDSAIRKTIGVGKLAELPLPEVTLKEKVPFKTAAGLEGTVESILFTPEPGIVLPALRFRPANPASPKAGPVLFLHEQGKTAAFAPVKKTEKQRLIDDYLQEGRTVLAVDLRGIGETQSVSSKPYFDPKSFGPDGQQFYLAYLLGRTYIGMRTEDLWNVARWLKSEAGEAIDLYAQGMLGPVALHAAALEPNLFVSVATEQLPPSWSEEVRHGLGPIRLTNSVHGTLPLYDWPLLITVLGSKYVER